MYMMQNIEKSRHKQLERKAREDRRRALSLQTGKSEEELRSKETAIAQERGAAEEGVSEVAEAAPEPTAPEEKVETPPQQAEAASDEGDDVFDFEDDDDDLF